MSHDLTPDALIIGAGPAGSLAALILARAGWDITLVEQHPFPRDKVCGECLSALGLSVLDRAGLSPILLTTNPVQLTHATLHARDGSFVRLPLGQPMCGLSRLALDAILLNAAKEAGARVLQPARCESLEPGDSPRATIRDLRSNQVQTLHPTIILLADGKGALLPHRPIPTTDFGIKAHFARVAAPRDTIQLFSVDGHYGGVSPIESNRWNAAFSIPAELLQQARGNVDQLFDQILRENIELHRQFSAATRVSAWQTSPLPRFAVSNDWPAGIIPLGNAAAALEPIGGEGMGLALRSAEMTAHALLVGTPNFAALRSAFNRLWKTRRLACRFAAKMLASPSMAGPTIDWLSSNDSLGGLALRLIGK